jgi:hypothetical protein
VGVGPPEAERVHRGPGQPADLGQRFAFLRYLQAQPVQVDLGIQRRQVQVRRDLTVLHAQGRLDQGGDPGRGLEVADVRLHGRH